MTEILKGALGGTWSWLMSFVFPAALFLGGVTLGMKSEEPDPKVWRVISSWSSDSRLVIAGFAALTFGTVLLAMNNVLLRILEGYIGIRQWRWLWSRMCSRHRAAKTRLANKLTAAQAGQAAGSLDAGFLIEQLMHYPVDDAQVGPTKFANAVRSFETYGATTYGLDSQTLWHEILASAPESVRTEESNARAYVDMLANLFFLSCLFAVISGAWLCTRPTVGWLASFVIAVLLIPLWYGLSVQAAYQWAGAVRALVNLGRLQLATTLGLELPRTSSREIDMWHEVVWLVRQGPDPRDPLYKYRRKSAPKPA